MSNPTPKKPGIRIWAPSADERAPGYPTSPSWLEVSNEVPKQLGDRPHAAYACGCGQTAEANGTAAVKALVETYGRHQKACDSYSAANNYRFPPRTR